MITRSSPVSAPIERRASCAGLASSGGLAPERRASPNGVNDRSDRSTADGRVVLIFEDSYVRRALRRLVNAVR